MVRVIQILRKFAFSHCGGGTGAEGWSVSPGRGAVGSVRGKTGEKCYVRFVT